MNQLTFYLVVRRELSETVIIGTYMAQTDAVDVCWKLRAIQSNIRRLARQGASKHETPPSYSSVYRKLLRHAIKAGMDPGSSEWFIEYGKYAVIEVVEGFMPVSRNKAVKMAGRNPYLHDHARKA